MANENQCCASMIHIKITYLPAADPGFLEGGGLITIFTSGGGYGRGRAPPVTARWSGGAL